MPVDNKTIDLDLSELEWIDEKTVVDGNSVCPCGKVQLRGGPEMLSGAPILDWPCCAGYIEGRPWRYCATYGVIIAQVKDIAP